MVKKAEIVRSGGIEEWELDSQGWMEQKFERYVQLLKDLEDIVEQE